MITRRDLLKAGASAAVLAAVPRPLLARVGSRPEPIPPIQDPRIKELTQRAVDVARASGAIYADARLTHMRIRQAGSVGGGVEAMHVGVRAMVGGYWGFASSSLWNPDEMARLGREAVHQAGTNALGKPRVVELAPVPTVRDGHWVMPVKLDGFELSAFEIADYIDSMKIYAQRTPGVTVVENGCTLEVQEKAFGSTEGTYCTQRLYRTSGSFGLTFRKNRQAISGVLDSLTPAGLGWELYREQPLRDHIRQLIEELKEDLTLPIKPVEVGRYDTLFDALSVSGLLDQTLGRATELDRALGYEANAGGTSYLDDPFIMIGDYKVGAAALTVVANRSEPGGAATVKWDDEAVSPDEFAIVRNGVLTDFQTTRESAGWLKEVYAKTNRPFHSHGCANARSALEAPLSRTPNLVLSPGREALDFDALVAGMSRGIAIKGAEIDMDFQNLSGFATGRVYEVRNGKRVARVKGAGLLLRASDVWKGLLALGGAASARRYGMSAIKGEPAQRSFHSVTGVPAVIKQLPLIDILRKA